MLKVISVLSTLLKEPPATFATNTRDCLLHIFDWINQYFQVISALTAKLPKEALPHFTGKWAEFSTGPMIDVGKQLDGLFTYTKTCSDFM